MSKNPIGRPPQDASRITLEDEDSVRYWTEKWGVGSEELADAVKAVGPRAVAVARYLGRSEYD